MQRGWKELEGKWSRDQSMGSLGIEVRWGEVSLDSGDAPNVGFPNHRKREFEVSLQRDS